MCKFCNSMQIMRKSRCFPGKFTQLAQILHDRRLRQISTLCERGCEDRLHDFSNLLIWLKQGTPGSVVELITFEILAAERLRLMGFDNRLIIDCFANVVNILIWQFSTHDRFKSEKLDSSKLCEFCTKTVLNFEQRRHDLWQLMIN